MIKIGLDFHGVISSVPDGFKALISRLPLLNDIQICVISGPPKEEIIKKLSDLGFMKNIFYFHEIFSIVDYLKEKNVKLWLDEKKTWWASDEEWWSAKACICKENNIDLMVDDSIGYKKFFGPGNIAANTHFILWNEHLTALMNPTLERGFNVKET